jgi:hypothetical protein
MGGADIRYKVRIQVHQPAHLHSSFLLPSSQLTQPPAIRVGIGIPPVIEGEIVGVFV